MIAVVQAFAGRTVRPLLLAGWLVAVGGTVALWVDDHTVLVSGPILVVVGGLTGVVAVARWNRPAVLVAIAQVTVCGVFVGCVLAFDWGPATARQPFAVMAPIYVAIVTWPTWRAWQTSAVGRHVPGTCDGCGYYLRGLTEPRCPECGRPFDPVEQSSV